TSTDGSLAPADAPGDAPSGDAPAAGAPAAEPVATAVVHLVRSGPAAFFVEPVPAAVPLGAPSGDDAVSRIARAVAALLAVVDPADPDLATSVPPGTLARDVILDGDVAVLDLGGALAGSSGGSAEEVTLAQQLAHTVVAAAPEVAGVRVLLEGRPIESLWGHLDWSVPLVADPFALSPVTIEVPAFGATAPVGEVTLTGRATVFEGTVLVRLERADGTVLEEGFVTATEGGPGRGTWTWTVTLPEPGEYRLVAGASDPSDGEGPPPFEVARTVTAG
ncbi:MAG: Gmad2 immunoglobulin-like domain-containing protein, partial [Nitriliruptoraceae bacterium]